ncbi:hypothetical protein [Tropicibacter sp. S64]|uniref:hypothetical protein n=1 Tax=Tropicibacter sp. S64 TaxID=3415122 RepID=UPI003C7C1BD2
MTNDDTLDRLKILIETERKALMDGDFEKIAELLDEKERFVGELNGREKDETVLEPLRDGLRRNQELYDHALAGLRNVANRISQANRARKSLETYDENGRRTSLGAPAVRTLERRA